MKQRSKKLAAGIVLAAAVLVAAVSLLLPWAVFHMQDAALFAQLMPRQRLTGKLSAEGEDIYLVRELHRRSEALVGGGEEAFFAQEISQDETRAQCIAAVQELGVHKTVASPVLDAALYALQLGDTTFTVREDSYGVRRIVAVCGADSFASAIGIEYHMGAARIIKLWVVAPEVDWGGEWQQSTLDLYAQYLGVSALDDFVASGAGGMAVRSSAKANLQLQCGITQNMLLLCVNAT